MNISFVGCGFLGLYHIGVVKCLKEFYPLLLQGRVSGSSSGSIIALAVIGQTPLGELLDTSLNLSTSYPLICKDKEIKEKEATLDL